MHQIGFQSGYPDAEFATKALNKQSVLAMLPGKASSRSVLQHGSVGLPHRSKCGLATSEDSGGYAMPARVPAHPRTRLAREILHIAPPRRGSGKALPMLRRSAVGTVAHRGSSMCSRCLQRAHVCMRLGGPPRGFCQGMSSPIGSECFAKRCASPQCRGDASEMPIEFGIGGTIVALECVVGQLC